MFQFKGSIIRSRLEEELREAMFELSGQMKLLDELREKEDLVVEQVPRQVEEEDSPHDVLVTAREKPSNLQPTEPSNCPDDDVLKSRADSSDGDQVEPMVQGPDEIKEKVVMAGLTDSEMYQLHTAVGRSDPIPEIIRLKMDIDLVAQQSQRIQGNITKVYEQFQYNGPEDALMGLGVALQQCQGRYDPKEVLTGLGVAMDYAYFRGKKKELEVEMAGLKDKLARSELRAAEEKRDNLVKDFTWLMEEAENLENRVSQYDDLLEHITARRPGTETRWPTPSTTSGPRRSS